MSSFKGPLVVATRNRKKTDEIREMLPNFETIHDVTDLEKQGISLPEIEETGTTFLANATLKAVGISALIDGLVLADDSGLEVDGLGGEPGVWSSSYGGEEGNHLKNNERLARELAAIPETARTGRFQCVMVLAEKGRVLAHFAGTVEGHLLSAAMGEGGFGYDPHFVPEGYSQTFAQLGSEAKNGMSHRGRALRQVVSWLEQQQR